jgi:serine/threonine protein kinase/tetratricopeptide (TPR) repeat protein
MPRASSVRVRFGGFELSLPTGELWNGNTKVVLQEQPLQILRMLIERDGELLPREDIKKKFWPNDTVVEFDHSINAAIKNLRRALGDSADEPKYIETFPRRGYRLMVPVEDLATDDSSASPSGESGGTAIRLRHEPGLIGAKVSHYRVLEVVGGGGMGMVYKAEDLKLGRHVALKFLPPELASDSVALQRFEREARAASSLDHPNICTIHEVEEHDSQPFIVMQLLHGETLRDRLAALAAAQNRLPLDELLDIAIQICHGLEAAHAKGIIHRDIKPANIFLTSTGQVKILDFGLAKLLVGEPPAPIAIDLSSRAACPEPVEGEPPSFGGGVEGPAFDLMRENAGPSTARPPVPQKTRDGEEGGRSAQDDDSRVAGGPAETAPRHPVTPADATLTRFGVAMGTEGYMSPEQIRGEKLDARTDVFSFGPVLYEMATGQRAFSGQTAAVVHDAILNNSPRPVRDLNSTLPARLTTVIDKALEKDRERRYQSAAEMGDDLRHLTARPSLRLPAKWKWSAAAAVLIAIVVAGSLYWRARRTFKLTEKDTIVLAHVVNNTGDTVIDDALDEPLIVKVAESPYIRVLYPSKVVDILMKVSNINLQNPKLTPELAREVCVRSDSRAFITAYIANMGNAYNIALNAQDCRSGKVLAKVERQTNDRNQIVKTLGAAGYQLRRELGEPEDSLARFNNPVENDTSWSLEALQVFNQAVQIREEQGDANAIPLFKRAVELDPNFAIAYLNLAAVYDASGETSLMVSYATKAFAVRERLGQRTRWFVEANYYYHTGELEKANATYMQWEQVFPDSVSPHLNRVACLVFLGKLEQATVEAREAVRLVPSTMAYGTLISPLLLANGLEEAKVVLEEAKGRGIDTLWLRQERYWLGFLQGDNGVMQEQLSSAMATPEGKAWAVLQPGNIATYRGRFRAAQKLYSVAQSRLHWSAASPPDEVLVHTALGYAETGNPVRARQAAEQAVSAGSNSKRVAALILARAGAVDQAESLARSLDQEFPRNTLLQNFELPTIRAAIELHKSQPARAIEILQSASPYDLASPPDSFETLASSVALYPSYLRGLAYLQLGQGREAAAEFQKMVDHPGMLGDFITAPLSHLQLGRAQAMMGDKAAARKSYQDFLTIWKDADPDIPIYQQAKAEYARLQ